MILPTLDRFKQVNPCNGCTACCTAVAVTELGKPARCRCEHETATGCAIYGNHPQECKKYACAWALGALGSDDKYRPDKCGLLFSLGGADERPSIGVFVLTPDCDVDKARYLLERVRKKFPGYPRTNVFPYGVRIGSAFACRPPYPPELSNRKNFFLAYKGDPSTMICQGPVESASQR